MPKTGGFWCVFCHAQATLAADIIHEPDCARVKARDALAAIT